MNFETRKLGQLGRFSQSGIDKKSADGEIPIRIVNYMDVYNAPRAIIVAADYQLVTAPASKLPVHLLRRGDVLITPSSETAEDVGHAAVALDDLSDTAYSYHVVRFRPFRDTPLDPEFSRFVFNSAAVRSHLEARCKGTTRQILTRKDFNSIPIPLPDLPTQKAIAAFLDRETARIDQLIEKKQRLVELSQARLTAALAKLVEEAGGETIQPIHRLCQVVTGKTPPRADEANFSLGEGLPWATPADLNPLIPITKTKERITERGMAGQPVVPRGTVLLGGIGEIGRIGFAGRDLSFNQQIHALVPKPGVLILGGFLRWALLQRKSELESLSSKTVISILNASRLGRIRVALPSIEKQSRAIEEGEALIETHLRLPDQVTASIDRLKEYRSALITAAVTGQIDVETWSRRGQGDRRLDRIEEEMAG